MGHQNASLEKGRLRIGNGADVWHNLLVGAWIIVVQSSGDRDNLILRVSAICPLLN